MDKILCDVTDMDACHLLLRRPWQYDVKSKHDGETNVYTITKVGIKYTMNCLPDDGKLEHVVSSVALVGEKDTLCFAIITRPKKEILVKPKEKPKKGQWWEDVGPKEVRDLLEKYHVIVVDNIPTSLPPKREVSHCIELIPGATLLNKAA